MKKSEDQQERKPSQSTPEGFKEPEEKGKENPKKLSNLMAVLHVIGEYLKKFQASSHQIDNQNARIVDKYPKYLSKFSLIGLQFDDFLFRLTFLFQVLVFTQTLGKPIITAQKNVVKLDKGESMRLKEVEEQTLKLIQGEEMDGQNSIGKNIVRTLLENELNWV